MALREEKIESSLLVAAQPQLATRLDVQNAVLKNQNLHMHSTLTGECMDAKRVLTSRSELVGTRRCGVGHTRP